MILSTHSYMDCKSLTFLCPVMTPLGCKIELMFGELHLMYNCVAYATAMRIPPNLPRQVGNNGVDAFLFQLLPEIPRIAAVKLTYVVIEALRTGVLLRPVGTTTRYVHPNALDLLLVDVQCFQ